MMRKKSNGVDVGGEEEGNKCWRMKGVKSGGDGK